MRFGRGHQLSLLSLALVLFAAAQLRSVSDNRAPHSLVDEIRPERDKLRLDALGDYPAPEDYSLDGIRLGMTEAEVRSCWGKLEKRYLFTGDAQLEKPGGWRPYDNSCLLGLDGRVVSVTGRHLRLDNSLLLSRGSRFDPKSLGEVELFGFNHCGNVSSLKSGFVHGDTTVYIRTQLCAEREEKPWILEVSVRNQNWEQSGRVDEAIACLETFCAIREVYFGLSRRF